MSKKILLAEDEPNVVESLTFLLQRAGYDVSVATDGQHALDLCLNNTPDVLVLDVMLPQMNGYEVLRRLRADQRTVSLPILVLTAKFQDEDRETALEYGASAFISKPYDNGDVTATVQRLIQDQNQVQARNQAQESES